ncbi:unnamed protein product [Brachionus calyciflorus]|uniref:OTU domain-containing protein n=1 Tax=Brachionus calyciflorus TaxID=104777 RepID=A0A813Q4T7_9BILA|nr:unnamed protein product [Brachionus calyciflorus]
MSVGVYNTNLVNKDLKKKFTKTFDLSQIAEDPMDIYLDTLGLWKKRIARDGSCLFRAVAEQIYPCQMYHEKVRQECIRYMSDHRDEFSKYVTTISFDEYLEAMKNPLENGGQLEIAAMSKLYKKDFIIFQHQDQPGLDVTQNGFERKVYLCFSYNNHFDAIFTKAHRDNLAVIQSLVYELLYDRVFGSGEQVTVARKLLRKSDTIYPKEYMQIKEYDDFGNEIDSDAESLGADLVEELQDSDIENSTSDLENNEDERNENSELTSDQNNNEIKKDKVKKIKKPEGDIDKLSLIQKMPLPYKVAKSLDPYIYRNTAFDAWLATKKELEQAANLNAISVLQPGDKCMVKLINNYTEKWSLAFFQNILHDTANVFVPELNEHHCVTLDNLKVYNNANELLLIHYTGANGQQSYHPMPYQYNNPNGVQNVQKFVQPINANFSKIFINIDQKRRNANKKKQFMKKSSSFHAFSNELPTLLEVEEQNDDLFIYGGHPYYNPSNQHHPNMYHPSNSGANMAPFYPIPHSQTHPNFTEHTFPPSNKMQSNKNSPGVLNQNFVQSNTQNNMKNRRPRIGSAGSNQPPNPNPNKGLLANPTQNNSFISHQLAPPLGPQLGPTQTPHMPLSGGMNLPPPPPFIPPPPMHHQPGVLPPPGPAFMHPPQPPMGPHPHPQPPQMTQPRPNFYNPITSSFMFGPPPPIPVGHHPHPHMSGLIEHQNFYFPVTPGNSSKPVIKQRHDSVDSFLNKPAATNGGYQQVPQHMNLLNNQNQNGTNSTNEQPNANKNNYLLMPVPQNNSQNNTLNQPPLIQTTPGSYQSSSLTRSHSYHSGISSYESHNQLINQNSACYVDIYPPPPQPPQQSQNQNNLINNGNSQVIHQTNGSLINNNNLLQNTNGSQGVYTSTNNNIGGLDINGLGYEMQYSRFDNSSLTSNGIIDDNLLNGENRSSNPWNNSKKLTKSTSLFSDMVYAGESAQPNLVPVQNPANNQPFCYSNCFVVNIDGPINFNATHSLQDDGSDLPFNDVNTVRFFYNLGIEYYRLNFPYNQGPNYSTLYAPGTNNSNSNIEQDQKQQQVNQQQQQQQSYNHSRRVN